jgi:hypothetical protein
MKTWSRHSVLLNVIVRTQKKSHAQISDPFCLRNDRQVVHGPRRWVFVAYTWRLFGMLVTRYPPLSKPIDIALKGMAAFLARPSRAVIPPKPRSGLRCRRKGVDGEDFGRATIGLAMIGSDHAWTSSVLVHRKVEPSIHMRCRITASLRATATLARFIPRRLATSSPQRLSAEKRVTRESNTFAAS